MKNPKAATSFLQIVSFLSFFLIAIFPHPILSTKSSKGIEFLKNLEGCQKGQTVKGLREVKLYLKKFGYADAHIKNHTEYENSDQFDDILEKEIRTYQLYYHLNATGTLDAETVKQMTLPRCGMPDIVKGKINPMRLGKKNHNSGGKSSSLESGSHYSYTFFSGMPKWPLSKSHLTYRFSSSIHVTDIETLKAVCSSAFARWEEVTHFTFSEAVHEADILIGFHRRDHGDGYSFDGPGRTVAHAFRPTIGWFHYDADENWSTNPARDSMDLESVAVHEIGHLLGLGHSREPNAIMYPEIPSGSIKRQLYADDIQGIRALYRLQP